MPDLLINGKRIKIREKKTHASEVHARLSGRRLLISPRIDTVEIVSLRKKIEDLEKKVCRRPVRIEMRHETPRHEISADDIRRIIKEEISTNPEPPKERRVFLSRRHEPSADIWKKKLRLKQTPEEKTGILAVDYGEKGKQATGISIPQIIENIYDDDKSDTNPVSLKYPLIPRNPMEGERVYSYAHIFFDNTRNEMMYNVIEPAMDDRKTLVLEEIKDYIQEKIDVNFGQIKRADAIKYIEDAFDKAIRFMRIKMDTESLDDIRYYVIRDFIGLEKIEPFIQDSQIEDISCDGVGIPIFIYHRNAKIGSIKTNVKFESRELVDSFVNKLAERCGKTLSVAKPMLDGSLPEGSRVQATLGSDIARHGSNFTIRMFTEDPITPIDIIKSGMCDMKIMATIWLAVEYQSSILVSGGTATGKTSLLNALSLFIRPQMKIVSIEDTPELRLPHSHWVPEVARSAIAVGHEVDMFELLRESLRQRPDYIIVGEVRGKEAYVLFQQMVVGHAGMSTIHADSFQKLIDRLTAPPIDLPANLLQNLDFVIFVRRVKRDNRYKRRIDSVVEINGYDRDKDSPIVNEIFRWNPANDSFVSENKSIVLGKIAEKSNMTEEDIREEIHRRAKILEWMTKRGIKDYKKVSSIINLYYLSPEFLMKKMGL